MIQDPCLIGPKLFPIPFQKFVDPPIAGLSFGALWGTSRALLFGKKKIYFERCVCLRFRRGISTARMFKYGNEIFRMSSLEYYLLGYLIF
ncbi:uncharacterized protein BJX67DRAFT_15242 [Aspergillus lucknowensis]|uniref:Uncharacterized protein n=1 Tax=Aspergillus lucknowensis TaxID=176173 RepID=A0ABR4M821_9EURO